MESGGYIYIYRFQIFLHQFLTIFPSSSPNLHNCHFCIFSYLNFLEQTRFQRSRRWSYPQLKLMQKMHQGLTTSISQKNHLLYRKQLEVHQEIQNAYGVRTTHTKPLITWHKPTKHTCWVGIAWKLGHHFSQVSSLNCFPEVASPRISTLKGRHAFGGIIGKPWNPKVLRLRPDQFSGGKRTRQCNYAGFTTLQDYRIILFSLMCWPNWFRTHPVLRLQNQLPIPNPSWT